MKAKKLIKEILEGVKFIHDEGVVHRDLKPDNIIVVSNKETPKIIDFNVAKKCKNKEFKMLSKVGLDRWNTPEVILRTAYNEKVDLWGVGSIFYFIMTGEVPFLDNNIGKLH